MDLAAVNGIVEELRKNNDTILDLRDIYDALEGDDQPDSFTERIRELLECFIKKAADKEKYEESYNAWISNSLREVKNKIKEIVMDSTSTAKREKLYDVLLKVLPLYVNCNIKPTFPIHEYSELLELAISSQNSISFYLNILNEYMIYEDMYNSIWKSLDIALRKVEIETYIVKNVLQLISTLVKKSEKPKQDEVGPVQYYCGTKIGMLKEKDLSKYVQRVWEQLSSIDIPINIRQHLLQTLLERMIFKIDKPIFLTDYFMSSLQCGGPVSILALQGIFTLIQKHNINYPNIYEKLYDLLNPSIFGMNYKARLFFLTDVFLSSLHLPEALVAGFAKRLSRLTLVAPPSDIAILLALITNLIIRHSGLNKLITNMEIHKFESDPYIASECDPSASKALESSLWEIKLLQHHVLPSVSSAAMFIENPLPSVECDLSDLLEGDSQQIFSKEIKKKMKNPPISFENPTLVSVEKGLTFWELL